MFRMNKPVIAAIATLVSVFTLLAVSMPIASAQASLQDADVAKALRAGDLVMVVRHGATFPDQADTDPTNFDNIAAQRHLNDKGKALAKAFGEAIRQAGVPVGKVYTSKFNRAYETAVIAGFKDIEKTTDLTEGGLIVSPNENNRRADAFRKMIATPPEGPHGYDPDHTPAEYRRCTGQGLVRHQGRGSLDLPPGRWRLQARGARADGRMATDRSGQVS